MPGYKRKRPAASRSNSNFGVQTMLMILSGLSLGHATRTSTAATSSATAAHVMLRGTTMMMMETTTTTSDEDGETASSRLLEEQSMDHLEAVLKVSSQLQMSMGVVLILICVLRIVLFGAIVRWRNRSALQLAQPMVLALLVGSGTVAIASCYLILPLNDTHCLLREPLLLTPLTLCGNILAGRVWRITLVMSPILQMEQAREGSNGCCSGAMLKQNLLAALTTISDFEPWNVSLFGRRRGGSSAKNMGRRNRSTLRHKVTIARLLWLVFLLTLPQLILQLCHLAIPGLRSHYDIDEFQAYDSQDVIVVPTEFQGEQHHTLLGRASCEAPTGPWITGVGMLFMVIPYGLGAILCLQASGDLPKVFDETHSVISTMRVVALVMAVAGPAWAMVDSPDGRSYLLICMVWSIAMAPIWFLVYPKVWTILSGSSADGETMKIGQILRKASTETRQNKRAEQQHRRGRRHLGDIPNLSLRRQQNNHEKSAKLALTIGKMYEDMGLVQKSITLFDDALAVWQCDPARDRKEKIGGFTMDEINSFSPKDLEYIIQLLIAKGRVEGTFHSAVQAGQKNAAQAWLDALEIYESAPSSVDMSDRSMIFPIFSGLFVFLKGGRIQQDAHCNFEQNLVRKFVRETKLHGDPVHYTRALAMQCEVKARLGRYEAALESFEILKSIYDPEEHSEGVAEAYGTDRSGQAFSQRALWLMQLGRMEEALDACEDVIRCLLPLMDPKNVLNMCELLLPVIRILKPRGQQLRMKHLFEEHVVENFHKHFGKDGVTPCLPIFKPLTMLLDICHCGSKSSFPGLDDAVEWLVRDEESCNLPDFLDSVYTKLCWSPNGMMAELCLRVASKLNDKKGTLSDVHALLVKGLRLARKAERKMRDKDGTVTLPIAYGIHEPVVAELEALALQLGLDDEDILLDPSKDGSGRVSFHNSAPDIGQLPASYTKTNSDSSSAANNSNQSVIRPSKNLKYAARGAALSGSDESGVGHLDDSAASRRGFHSSILSDTSTDIPPVAEEISDTGAVGSAGPAEMVGKTAEENDEGVPETERSPSRSSSASSFDFEKGLKVDHHDDHVVMAESDQACFA